MANRIWQFPRKLICGAISLYQQTLSPDHGPLKHLYPYGYCRHEPTCSEYAKQSIARRGVLAGSAMGIRRLLSCNPWKQPSDEKILRTIGKSSHL